MVYNLQVSQKLGKLYSEMIFQRGFVHCDPHPGNILVRARAGPGGGRHGAEIIMLDHGLYTVSNRHAWGKSHPMLCLHLLV